ncbi:MAG: hypothetical protein LBH42_03915 [Treponema sp.]|jgi:putative DNA primase/helicase|nr:hypothetical protein [Treponema sp.]
MQRQETTRDISGNSIGDEGVYLRIQQLRNGLLQLTDATTAERMLKEFGKDIRYIAPWKKWIVWNGSYWDVDSSGAFIYTMGLEIVRSIYLELAKTADYRERMEIEKYAIKNESTRSRENMDYERRYRQQAGSIYMGLV